MLQAATGWPRFLFGSSVPIPPCHFRQTYQLQTNKQTNQTARRASRLLNDYQTAARNGWIRDGLFNDSVSAEDDSCCPNMRGWLCSVHFSELGRKRPWRIWRHDLNTRNERLYKSSQCLGWDLNQVPPDYRSCRSWNNIINNNNKLISWNNAEISNITMKQGELCFSFTPILTLSTNVKVLEKNARVLYKFYGNSHN